MASVLTASVLTTSVAIFIFAYYSWIKGAAHVMAESDSALAVQTIDRQLRQAMSVALDANGNGLTYEMPMQNPDGSYPVPLVWDNVTRRIALVGNNLVMSGSDGSSQTLAWSICPYDPASPNQAPYTIFTAQPGQAVTILTVMVVTTQSDGHQNAMTSRSRQAVFLRNIPQSTQ